MKIWITGIAGFLGSHLADALRKSSHTIVGNDNFLCSSSYPVMFRLNNELKEFDLDIDCTNRNEMYLMLDSFKPDVLIHCAATAHEGLSSFSPSFITKNIYEASVATFSAAIAAGVKRIIFMSSMARYGNGMSDIISSGGLPEQMQTTLLLSRKAEGTVHSRMQMKAFEKQMDDLFNEIGGPPFREDFHAPRPVDPYGIAKVAAEETLKVLAKTHGIEYVIAVPHNIIGPRQKYDDPFRNVASIMINRALQNKPIIIYGDGSQKRCFSPISDCLHSLTQMIDAPINGEVINIGPDGGEITILELAELIRDITGKHVDFEFFPGRPNEVKEAFCSSDKARRLLGFNPQQNLRACLSEMVDYIENNGVKPFNYHLPIEIERGCPQTWVGKLI